MPLIDPLDRQPPWEDEYGGCLILVFLAVLLFGLLCWSWLR